MRKPANRFIASFDTEDDGKGNPYLWAIVHENGSWYAQTRVKALEYILTLARDLRQSNTILELWATNLEYDLVNLYGPERLKELNLTFGKSYLVGAAWTGHNTIFRDTVRHIPLSVRELGELVGMPKLEMVKGTTENIRYCIRDATITRRTAKWLNNIYSEFGITPKQTLASCALTIWREKYWKREVRLPEIEIVRNSKEAYHGGRTEAFANGEWCNITVLDVASMFPWAMITKSFPLPWGPFKRIRSGGKITDNGVYLAKIESQCEYPSLPFRTGKGTVYANGEWSAWYIGHELLYARENGAKVEIVKGYEFLEECEPFKEYVQAFFKLKNSAKGPARLGYKLLLNALYGKFGQTGDKVRAEPLEKFVNKRNPPDDFRIWHGIAIYSEKGAPPPWGNNIWSAIITARARVRLAKEMQRVRGLGGTVLYCDTDSIIYAGAENLEYPEKAKEAGDFELRGKYPKIYIAGKKEYGLCDFDGKWEIHVKGVPLAAREEYLFKGEASYQKPTRLREAARRGKKANEWNEVSKTRKVNFNNRTLRHDKTFHPILIKGQENG